ncbi:E1 ubiquitin-activating protein aos1 [Blastocladiella emersonii ATCC 22665]|nr:E1 ubiquitin-activating protein aos1 [Blastocladiella emersonii ATCC 22665]
MNPPAPTSPRKPTAKRAHSSSPSASASQTSPTSRALAAASLSPAKRFKSSASTPTPAPAATDDDASEIYDRQIRLWGAAAQHRLRSARVAVAGDLARGLAVETVKALALAGVGTLVLVDDGRVVEEGDFGTNFFAAAQGGGKTAVEVMKEGVGVLNPMVKVEVVRGDVEKGENGWVKLADVVLACDVSIRALLALSKTTRAHTAKLLAGNVFGNNGLVVADLLRHTFVTESTDAPAVKDGDPVVTRVRRTVEYPSLDHAMFAHSLKHAVPNDRARARAATVGYLGLVGALVPFWREHGRLPTGEDKETLFAFWEKAVEKAGVPKFDEIDAAALSTLLRAPHAESNAAAAITGGVLAQETVKAVQGKHRALANTFVFLADTSSGDVLDLGTREVEAVKIAADGE